MLLTEAPVFSAPKFDHPFQFHMDASNVVLVRSCCRDLKMALIVQWGSSLGCSILFSLIIQ